MVATIDVLVSLSDSALRDADYIPINTVLPATYNGSLNTSVNRVNITVVDDLDVEGNETFLVVLELINPPANVLMGIMNTTIVIIDNGIIIVAAISTRDGSLPLGPDRILQRRWGSHVKALHSSTCPRMAGTVP